MEQGHPTHFDIPHFCKLIEEAPTIENGWTLDAEGTIHKSFPDSKINVYKKKLPDSNVVSIKYDAIIKNVDINKWAKVSQQEHRKKWDPFLKHMEHTPNDDGTKLVYLQAKMPFPLTDRDMVQRSFTICNKTNVDLITRYNLPQHKGTYYFGMIEPAMSSRYPERRDHVRGETRQATFVEELPDGSGIRIRSVNKSDIKGDVPKTLLNALAGKGPFKILGKQIEMYPKLVKEGVI